MARSIRRSTDLTEIAVAMGLGVNLMQQISTSSLG
jgi:hypothetical protein